MDNTNESQEFDLDDILREFHEDPDDDVKDTASEEELDVDVLLVEEVSSPAPEQPEAPETAEAPSALTPKRFPKKRRKPLPATTPEQSTI